MRTASARWRGVKHRAVGCNAQNVRLRSANRGNANNTWYVNAGGNVNNHNAYNANRAAADWVLHRAGKSSHSEMARKRARKEPKALPETAKQHRGDAGDPRAGPANHATDQEVDAWKLKKS